MYVFAQGKANSLSNEEKVKCIWLKILVQWLNGGYTTSSVKYLSSSPEIENDRKGHHEWCGTATEYMK